jgi:IclR family KDG regulon transcriptional repressor
VSFRGVRDGAAYDREMVAQRKVGKPEPVAAGPVGAASDEAREDPADGLGGSGDGSGTAAVGTSVRKALRIVEAVAEQGPMGAAELARRIGTTRATAHRLGRELLACGWLTQGADSRFRLGARAFAICTALGRLEVREEILGLLGDLRDRTEETVQLTARIGQELVYLEQLSSPRPVLSLGRVGERVPVHSVSGGLAILAFEDPGTQAQLLQGPLARLTPETVSDPAELRAELEAIRTRGYAVNLGRRRSDVGGVGAPVLDARGRPVAAVSVCVPLYRLDDERVAQLGPEVQATARAVGALLRLAGSAGPLPWPVGLVATQVAG